MTTQQYIITLVEWESTNGYKTADLICGCFNCHKAEILPSGDVWISDPQQDHVLDEAELDEFVQWHKKQV